MTLEELKAHYAGLKDGVKLYAYWNNGTQYVGTTGKTLQTAINELNKEEQVKIAKLKENFEINRDLYND